MADRRKIEEKIRKKEQEIQGLEEQIKAARVYVQALQDVLRMFPKDSGEDNGPATLRSGSSMAQARDAILKHGAPMHINELMRAVGKEVTPENRAALAGSIAAYVRRGEIFTRPAPNTFGLLELSTPQPMSGPPPGFGKDSPSDDDEIPF